MAAQRTESWEFIVGYSLYFDSVSIFHFRFSSFARYWCANITTDLVYSVQFFILMARFFRRTFGFVSIQIFALYGNQMAAKEKFNDMNFWFNSKMFGCGLNLMNWCKTASPMVWHAIGNVDDVRCVTEAWVKRNDYVVCVCAINSCRKRWTDIKLLGLRNKRADRQHIEIEWITNQYAN